MAFTFVVIEKDNERIICPLNEQTKEPYTNHSFDVQSFINQFKDGVILEVSEPGVILKDELARAKKLLSAVKSKLRSPGRYDAIADEIERFLTDDTL